MQPTAENPFLEIHGALIKFSNLNHFHNQLEENRDKLSRLKFFHKIDDTPHNRTDYLFRYGQNQIRVTTRSALVKRLPDNRYKAPIDLQNTVEFAEGLIFPFEEMENKVLERCKGMFVSFLKRIRLESNGQLKIGRMDKIGFEGWTQKREYAFNYGEDKVRLSKTQNGVRLALQDLPDGWLDHSPLPGMKAEAEGLRSLAQDLGLVRALRSQGIVTEESLDQHFDELVNELRGFGLKNNICEEVVELKETQRELVESLKTMNNVLNELDVESCFSMKEGDGEESGLDDNFYDMYC